MENNYDNIQYADLESEPKESLRKTWTGTYKGIRYEINNFRFGPTDDEDRWTHYIILNLDQQYPKEVADMFWLKPSYEKSPSSGLTRISYNYFDSPVAKLEWHGGCTFYEKLGTVDDTEECDRWVKMGCDYQHYWDQGRTYCLASVHSEVRATIKSLINKFGDARIRSNGDGKYRYIHEFKPKQAKQ